MIFCFAFVDESKAYLKSYETMYQYFIETSAFKEAEDTFNKHGIVILTGPSGCGKTFSAVYMMYKQLNVDCTFRKINSWEELFYIEQDEKTIVFIDNIFSPRTLDKHLEKWWYEFRRIYNQYFESNETKPESRRLRIVITARINVIEQTRAYMESGTPILNDVFMINLRTLTQMEKNQIFLKQIEFAKRDLNQNIDVNADFIQRVSESDGPIAFPFCAHLYVCNAECRKLGSSFFSNPDWYLKLQIKDEIVNDESNRTKSLFFVLFFHEWHTKRGNTYNLEIKHELHCKIFLNKLSTAFLSNFGPFEFEGLENVAQRLLDTYFKKVDNHTYKFFNESVYEAVGTFFCEKYCTEAAKYFPLDIIKSQFNETMTKRCATTLATRLIYETIDQRLSGVFACKILRDENFAQCFCTELKKKDNLFIHHFFTVSNESSQVKLPCMFWSSFNSLTFLTELFYDIINERNIFPNSQLYLCIYGTCCSRSEYLIKTSNKINSDKSNIIQEQVLHYNDSEGNSTLHLLISSEYSDKFTAIAVQTLTKDGMSVCCKNNKRETPVMVAVEQKLPRLEVIKNLIRFPGKLRIRDLNDSSVFHHCLGSCNDDAVCAEYLNILLNERDAKDLLSITNVHGDTALGIAAKTENQSRIRSILILLENNADIINTLNEDGFSPLHVSVRFLKGESLYAELECCVRVITLILYGAEPEKCSAKNKRAIDECSYGSVKSILKNPNDEKNMEKKLNLLLQKLKNDEPKEKRQECCISSKKLSIALCTCIEEALHYLTNVAFQ